MACTRWGSVRGRHSRPRRAPSSLWAVRLHCCSGAAESRRQSSMSAVCSHAGRGWVATCRSRWLTRSAPARPRGGAGGARERQDSWCQRWGIGTALRLAHSLLTTTEPVGGALESSGYEHSYPN
jgi:hypothetical protein